MSSNDRDQIQQMEQGGYNFSFGSSLKRLHQKCMKSQLVAHADIFSIPIKLNINGQENYKTAFGGFIHLVIIGICIMLTMAAIYPNGFALQSQITKTIAVMNQGDNGQSIFDHTDQPISFNFYKYNAGDYYLQASKQYVQLYAYQIFDTGQKKQLNVSTNCSYGQFCLRNDATNKGLSIYGSEYKPSSKMSRLTVQMVWCNQTDKITCITLKHYLEIKYSNFYKQKGLGMTQFKKSYFYLIKNNYKAAHNITRQEYTSNYKYFGHISNIFPQTLSSFRFSDIFLTALKTSNTTYSGYNSSVNNVFTYEVTSSGQQFNIKQVFDDIVDPLLFFLSVKQTFFLLVFLILIKEYNRNSGLLEVGSSLYYVNNFQKKNTFHFDRSYQTFLACFLRNHFLFKFINFILKKFGKTFYDYLPNKTICAFSLINKAQILLQENHFFKQLNTLTLMENQPLKKIPFVEQQNNVKQNQNESQTQTTFFEDQNMDENKKMVYKKAFQQFCQDNNYVSMKRKKTIYKVLTNNKLKHILAYQMQKQFKNYVRHARSQMNENQLIQENSFSQQNNEIKIQVHDMSNNQLTAGQLIHGKRKDSF